MNRLLQKYSHNTLVDQVLYWSANRRKISRIVLMPIPVDAAQVIIQFEDGSEDAFHIQAGLFQEVWDEARTVFAISTNIPGDFRELTATELDLLEPARRTTAADAVETLQKSVARDLEAANNEVQQLFKDGLYQMFLDETGVILKDPSNLISGQIAYASKHAKVEP